jgi:DNA uptake protein ComE-like DNA-binding protein
MRTRQLALGLALIAAMTGCADTETEDETAATTGDIPGQQPPPAVLVDGQMLDPNTAAREQLVAISQLDAARVDAIIAGRPYTDMVGVDRVLSSMSESDRDLVYAHLWMPIDLNTATDEQILLIPGIGDRMLHEFKEYRPYTNIEQFRREMGKYVDETEIARMERYVTIRQ